MACARVSPWRSVLMTSLAEKETLARIVLDAAAALR